MRFEITALHANGIGSLVSFEPSMNVVGCRWVYKIKCRADGAVECKVVNSVSVGVLFFQLEWNVLVSECFGVPFRDCTVHIYILCNTNTMPNKYNFKI